VKPLAGLALLSLLAPVAAADTTSVGASGVGVSVTTSDVPHCVVKVPIPCPFGYDDNSTPTDPTDDTLYLNRSVDRIAVWAPAAPSQDLDLDHARINHSAYGVLQETIVGAHESLPAPARSLFTVTTDDSNTNIGFQTEALNGTQPTTRTRYVDVGVPELPTNRTGTSIPDGWGTDDSDVWGPLVLEFARLCWVTDLGSNAALTCNPVAGQGIKALETAWPQWTPRIVTDAHVRDIVSAPSREANARALGRAADAPGSRPAAAPASLALGDRTFSARARETAVPATALRPPAVASAQEARHAALDAEQTQLASPVPFPLAAAALLGLLVPLALLYHRITERKALQNTHRAHMHRLLGERGASDVAQLARELGLAYKSAAHHVAVLERCGLVRVARHGNRCLVFRGDEATARRVAQLRHPLRRSILELVQASPGLRQADLARRLGCGRNVVHAHVHALLGSGALTAQGNRLYAPMHEHGRMQAEHRHREGAEAPTLTPQRTPFP
jgi:predicted ArsR family transcriptional regulator